VTSPSHAQILALAYAKAVGDTALMAMLPGGLFNHVPQDEALPCCRVRWEDAGEFDTKDSDGFDGSIAFDVWTDHRGDKQALAIQDRLDQLFQNASLSLTSPATSVVLQHYMFHAFTEPDGLTHHAVVKFRLIAST
jgi:hypothetical protein